MRSETRLTIRRTNAPKRIQRPECRPGPIVKWAGGKTRLLRPLLSRRPPKFRRYFEPFLGGGALFFKLAPKSALLTDRNHDLINMYRCVAWNVEAVIRRLATHQRQHCEEHYYRTRSRWNDKNLKQSDIARAATFIYLNKTCYNGLWRVNRKGLFNVPMGRYESPKISTPDQLRVTSKLLQGAELQAAHYVDAVANAEYGDFVYFDPPYHPITSTAKFTSYTSESFGSEDQRELAATARWLCDRGATVMISNSDTQFIRRLYRGFRIDRVTTSRAINSKSDGRGTINEVIITNQYA